MAYAWFVAGTDTGVGKTFISSTLLRRAAALGFKALGMKPIAAGVDEGESYNEDTLELIAAASHSLPSEVVTPYLLQQAIAPQIAAQNEGVCIDFQRIRDSSTALVKQADVLLVEGVGGFRVPLGKNTTGKKQDSADLAVALAMPVILVVDMRLGCQNHSLLSVEAIASRGLTLAGWVANTPHKCMPFLDENISLLAEIIEAPLLGVVPPGQSIARSVQYLRLPGEEQMVAHGNADASHIS